MSKGITVLKWAAVAVAFAWGVGAIAERAEAGWDSGWLDTPCEKAVKNYLDLQCQNFDYPGRAERYNEWRAKNPAEKVVS